MTKQILRCPHCKAEDKPKCVEVIWLVQELNSIISEWKYPSETKTDPRIMTELLLKKIQK